MQTKMKMVLKKKKEKKSKSESKRLKTKSSGGIYVPPKLTAVHYDEETEADRTKKINGKNQGNER